MHNFTQIKNRDFKSRFQLKNEMCVKLWVRTYVQQVLPITTGILPPTINYFYKIITKSDFFFVVIFSLLLSLSENIKLLQI